MKANVAADVTRMLKYALPDAERVRAKVRRL